MKQFLEKFGVSLPENRAELFAAAQELARERGNAVFDFESLNIYTVLRADIARIRDALAQNPDNALYVCLLYLALKRDDSEAINALSHPKGRGSEEANDTLPLFPLLYAVPEMVRDMREKGIPEDVIRDSCKMFETQVQDFLDLYGRCGISRYVRWVKLFLDGRIIRVGRFDFEWTKFFENRFVFSNGERLEVFSDGLTYHASGKMLGSVGCEDAAGSFTPTFRETETEYIGHPLHNGFCEKEPIRLKKSEWEKVLSPDDPVIGLHIPSGGRLDPEQGERDIRRACEIFETCFGEAKGIVSLSWLLSEKLVELIGKPSGLTWLARLFHTFPFRSPGSDVFEYLYLLPPDSPLEKLPERTSLQKKVKDYLLQGGHVQEAMGVFLVEKERFVK